MYFENAGGRKLFLCLFTRRVSSFPLTVSILLLHLYSSLCFPLPLILDTRPPVHLVDFRHCHLQVVAKLFVLSFLQLGFFPILQFSIMFSNSVIMRPLNVNRSLTVFPLCRLALLILKLS